MKLAMLLLCVLAPARMCEARSFSDVVATQFECVNACGPAALMRACQIAGQPVGWEDVCIATRFQGDPVSLLDLSRAAIVAGFEPTALKCTITQLERYGGPAIVDYPRHHFSVFLGWTKNGEIRIGDLRSGVVCLSPGDFASRWGGHLLLLRRSRRQSER